MGPWVWTGFDGHFDGVQEGLDGVAIFTGLTGGPAGGLTLTRDVDGTAWVCVFKIILFDRARRYSNDNASPGSCARCAERAEQNLNPRSLAALS